MGHRVRNGDMLMTVPVQLV